MIDRVIIDRRPAQTRIVIKVNTMSIEIRNCIICYGSSGMIKIDTRLMFYVSIILCFPAAGYTGNAIAINEKWDCIADVHNSDPTIFGGDLIIRNAGIPTVDNNAHVVVNELRISDMNGVFMIIANSSTY